MFKTRVPSVLSLAAMLTLVAGAVTGTWSTLLSSHAETPVTLSESSANVVQQDPNDQKDSQQLSFWNEERRAEYAKRQANPAVWNMNIFKEDLVHHKKHFPTTKPALSNFPSPVPNYGNFGGSITWPKLVVGDRIIRSTMFAWQKYDVNEHLAEDGSHNMIVYFNIFVLTDDTENDMARAMTSRNYPHVLSTGKLKTSVGEVDWVHTGLADGNNYAFINQRIFDLKFGKTIMVAPQKDGSLRFMQMESPSSYRQTVDGEFSKKYIEQLQRDEQVIEFFTNKNTIGQAATVQDSSKDDGRPEECKLPDVRDELTKRVARDQAARNALINATSDNESDSIQIRRDSFREMATVDRENTAWMKEQIDGHGWLGKTQVGTKGAHAAWLLVQHADNNLALTDDGTKEAGPF